MRAVVLFGLGLLLAAVGSTDGLVRVRRASKPHGTSVITVEWEGIQTLVDDGDIKGFQVEYRQESDNNWMEHKGLIPYRGPDNQYSVTIRDLPSGTTYFVRIKVIGQDDKVLVSTDELTAETKTQTQTGGTRSTEGVVRVRRAAQQHGTSILTVQWEGIQSHVEDGVIKGFQVEYRQESDNNWMEHEGLIPYRGPYYQYRVTIKDLPSGKTYFVRIKVIGQDDQVLVSTSEIRAETQTLPVQCEPDELSEPMTVELVEATERGLVFRWLAPQCTPAGSPSALRYECELSGADSYATFELHRATVAQTVLTLSDLLPGTGYQLRVRALPAAAGAEPGPWSSVGVEAKTRGTPPAVSDDVQAVYRSGTQLRVTWDKQGDMVQHYEVMILEVSSRTEGTQVWRARVPADQNSYLFTNLKPATSYIVGVVAHVDGRPVRVYKLNVETSSSTMRVWPQQPNVKADPVRIGAFSVFWSAPAQFANQDLKHFVVEYRNPEDTEWLTYGEPIDFRPGQRHYELTMDGLDQDGTTAFYIVRVYIVNSRGDVVAGSDEFRVGKAVENSCAGSAGIPSDVTVEYAEDTEIALKWTKPRCDETHGHIDSYEYKYWPSSTSTSDTSSMPVKSTSSTRALVSGLLPATTYVVAVRTMSKAGPSPWCDRVEVETKAASGATPGAGTKGNPYNMRVLLGTPKSHLAWTPLAADLQHIVKFKLSYKLSNKKEWTDIEGAPARFACPANIATENDFCFDLTDFTQGVQYTAKVVYQTRDGRWSEQGNPLFFILVEAEKPNIPVAPNGFDAVFKTPSMLHLSWLPPLYDEVAVDFYKIEVIVISSTLPDVQPSSADSFKIAGNVFTHAVTGLKEDTVYNVSVAAGTAEGAVGPSAWKVVSTGKGSQGPTIEDARVSQRGDALQLQWTLVGKPDDLCCFRVDMRTDAEGNWEQWGSLIPVQKDTDEYSAALDTLQGNTLYHIRITILDRSRVELHSAEPVRVKTECRSPAAAPTDVKAVANGPTEVLFTWKAPDRRFWNCDSLSYIIQGSAGTRAVQLRVEADPRAPIVEHRERSESGITWRVRVAASTDGGAGPWSQEIKVETETETATTSRYTDARQRRDASLAKPQTDHITYVLEVESRPAITRTITQIHIALVSTPRVDSRGPELLVSWQATAAPESIYGYRVEYRTSDTSRWTQYGQVIQFEGTDRPYRVTLTDLRPGLTYFVRVLVYDRSQNVLFTSPESSAATSCRPPSTAPTDVLAAAPDPSHVRISWTRPPASTWNCNAARIELEVTEPARLAGRPLYVDAAQRDSHVFDSRPNEKWEVLVRTVNSAGASQWAPVAQIRTSPGAELIINVRVDATKRPPVLTWQCIGGVQDLVSHYHVEWSLDGTQWRQHESGNINYMGAQQPYSALLTNLPEGEPVQVRVLATDYNNGNAFSTSPLQLRIEPTCRAPARPPAQLNAQSTGPTQIRVTWQALPRDQWNCDRVWYILKYSNPTTQGFQNYTDRDASALFDSAPFTEWSFQIQAVNEAGSSSWSQAATGATLEGTASPPLDLRYYQMGPNTVQVSWREPDRPNGVITGYEISYQLIDRGMCGATSGERQLVRTEGTAAMHRLERLHAHSKYSVSVAARTNTAVGQPETLELMTDTQAPTAPPRTIIAKALGSSEVELRWQAPPCLETNGDITEYEYEISGLDKWAESDVRTVINADTVAKVVGLTPFTRYSVRVRVYTSKGAGPWSEPQTVRTSAADRPNPPPTVRVVDTSPTTVQLMWTAPYPPHGEIDMYKVRYSIGGTGRWQERQFPSAGVHCSSAALQAARVVQSDAETFLCATVDQLQPEQLYDLQVSAHMSGSEWGPWSQIESARTGSGPVQVLSVEKTGGSGNNLEISWNVRPADQPRVIGFRIISHPLSDVARVQQYVVDGTTYRYRIDGLTPNTDYNVSVQARTQSGYHNARATVMRTDEASVPALSIPPRVVESRADSLTIEWQPAADPRGTLTYLVEYRTDPTLAWEQMEERVPHVQGQSSYRTTISSLSPNTNCEVRVTAEGSRNRRGDPSPSTNARTACATPRVPPQGIRVDSPSSTEVRIQWSRPRKDSWNCDHLDYELWSQLSGEAERVLPITGEQTEYTVQSNPHTPWTFKMRSTNQVGASSWSEPQSVTTQQDSPGAVRNLILDPRGPNTIYASWLEPQDKKGVIVGYDVSYRLKFRVACPEEAPRDATEKWITVYNLKQNDHLITGLLPNSEYEVRVQARTTSPGPGVTKTDRTRPTPPSAPPLDLKLSYKLERSLEFSWQPVECSQRHGVISNYEYELLGLDNWAKLERQIANTTKTQVSIEGLIPFTKYVMRVKAFNSAGGGPNTENLEVQTARADAPLPPQDLVVLQEGIDFFALSWVPPYPPYGPLESYKIRFKKVPPGTPIYDRRVSFTTDEDWVTVEYNSDDPILTCRADQPAYRACYNVSGQEPGQQFRIQVAAKIKEGVYGQWCEVVTANTLEVVPGAPSSIGLIDKSDSHLRIKWQPPVEMAERVTQYKISYRPCDMDTEPKTFTVDGQVFEYTINGLEPETCYAIEIQAGTTRGFGPGATAQMQTDRFQVPSVGTKPTASPDGAYALNVEWQGVSDPSNRVQHYLIEYRRANEPMWSVREEPVAHNSVKRTYFEKILDLSPDTTYMVRIRVVDKTSHQSAPSPEAEARTGCAPPSHPPSNVQLAAPSPQQVRMTWQAPPAYTWMCSRITYLLQYRNSSTGRWVDVDYPGSTTDASFGSRPYSLWTLRIRTVNPQGHSPWSEEVTLTTPQGVPGAVLVVNGRPLSSDSMEVSWEKPPEPNGAITGYTLVYRLKSKAACAVPPGQPESKNVFNERQVIDNLEADTTYEVSVAARTIRDGPQSAPILVTTHPARPTGAPLRVRVAAVNRDRAQFDYAPPECHQRNGHITSYEYEVEALDEWVLANRHLTGVSSQERADVSDLIPYTRYRFRVRAANSEGSGPYSEWVEFVTRPGPPPPPGDLRADQAFPTAVAVSFLPPSPPHGIVDEYRLRHTATDRISWVEVKATAQQLECSAGIEDYERRLCHRVSELMPDKEYAIQVSAHTKDGDWGDWTDSITVDTKEGQIPVLENPIRVKEQSAECLVLTFEGLAPEQQRNIDGYVLEYSRGAGDQWAPHGDSTIKPKLRGEDPMHTVQVCELDPDTGYYFRVRVKAKNGKTGLPGPSLPAATACGKPLQPPSAVQLVSTDYRSVSVSWSPPAKSTWQCANVLYVLHYSNNTHEGMIDISPTEQRTSHQWATLPGTTWTAKMRTQAVLSDTGQRGHVSEWSPEDSITIRVPGPIFVYANPAGPDALDVHWELPAEDKNWQYGVDVTYKLKQLGDCPPEQLTAEQRREFKVDNVETVVRQAVTARDRAIIDDLSAGTRYRFKVRAYTAAGPGPWSAPVDIRTAGSEIGPPRELHATGTGARYIALAWLPPYPLRGAVTGYRIAYATEVEAVDPKLVDVSSRDLSCTREKSGVGVLGLTSESRCYTLKELIPETTYIIKVQARSESGKWGDWSLPIYVGTKTGVGAPGGSLVRLAHTSNSIRVKWTPPDVIDADIKFYLVSATVAVDKPQTVPVHNVSAGLREFTFKGLAPVTSYNISVQGGNEDRVIWYISRIFATTDESVGPLSWLGPPQNLSMIYKTDTVMHVQWEPPEVLHPRDRERITSYKVTIAAYDPVTTITQPAQEYSTTAPRTDIQWSDLLPETVYNITVEACTEEGCGAQLWGAYSTLPPPGRPWVLRLIYRTPTSLKVGWNPIWGRTGGYVLRATPIFSLSRMVERTPTLRDAPDGARDFVIRGLTPNTIYNVSLIPKNYAGEAWGAYNTLPPGALVVSQLRVCKQTEYALSISWLPLEGGSDTDATHYQVRYTRTHGHGSWSEKPQKTADELMCPGVYNVAKCPKLCYLLFNLDNAIEYTVQVRAYVAGQWNRWKTVARDSLLYREPTPLQERACCIEPPDFYLDNIGEPNTLDYIVIKPVPNDTFVERYYVIADERETRGDINATMLTDMLTARRAGIPYYVAGSFNRHTLTQQMDFPVGDGMVYGGYLNYPLVKGKAYDFPFLTVWKVDDKPIVGWWRDSSGVLSGSWGTLGLVAAGVALVALLVLLCCLLFCCIGSGRYRRRTARVVGNGHTQPLLVAGTLEQDKEKSVVASDLKALESRLDNIRMQLDSRGGDVRSVATTTGVREADLHSVVSADYMDGRDTSGRGRVKRHTTALSGPNVYDQVAGNSLYERDFVHRDTTLIRDRGDILSGRNTLVLLEGDLRRLLGVNEHGGGRSQGNSKGDFEDGYVRGFKDSTKLGGAGEARAHLTEQYGHMQGDFHSGYVQGLRDAGMTGLSSSMKDLQQHKAGSGYSSGYMQGFRDGNSGIFGDRITTTLLHRLEEQYPAQDDFRQGYIEGFKEGAGSRADKTVVKEDTRLHESLSQLNERLQTLEKGKGDEIHTTKIYHVYNQGQEGMSAAGQQLAYELDESRKGTMRHHYTAGDYMRYGSDAEGYGASLRRSRRSLSATALGRVTDDYTPAGSPVRARATASRTNVSQQRVADVGTLDSAYRTQRYHQYRSKSDLGQSGTLSRRYASQTLLDGSRPGPTAHGWRRNALESLQKELDTLSRAPTQHQHQHQSTVVSNSTVVQQQRQQYVGQRRAAPPVGLPAHAGRQPHTELARGYSSDTGYLNDTLRSQAQRTNLQQPMVPQHRMYDYAPPAITVNQMDQHPIANPIPGAPLEQHQERSTGYMVQQQQHHRYTSASGRVQGGPNSNAGRYYRHGFVSPASHDGAGSSASEQQQRIGSQQQTASAQHHVGGGEWPENLMDIVQEPMPATLERMKKFEGDPQGAPPGQGQLQGTSTSGASGAVKETAAESYSASYKEYSTAQ